MSEFCTQYPDMDFNFITNGTTDHPLFYELMETNPHFYLQISLMGRMSTQMRVCVARAILIG